MTEWWKDEVSERIELIYSSVTLLLDHSVALEFLCYSRGMLKKIHRLKKDKEFKQVFRFSKPVNSGRLSLRASKSKNQATRFGFVISNKIDKRATRRNGLKRRLRAAASLLLSEVKPGYDVVVIMRESYNFPFDYQEIAKDFVEGVRKLDLIK